MDSGAATRLKDAALGVLPPGPNPQQWSPLLLALPDPQGATVCRRHLHQQLPEGVGPAVCPQGAKVRLGRQVDSMWEDQKQMVLESILVALPQKHRNSQG
uniref:Growth hormone releasing hormone n=1 Tax=Molossus molossus TaxID=27622 RepID=A0A7J8HGY4_MOLMO|nr:growth hormone releasing hormone [Molossus molossus]